MQCTKATLTLQPVASTKTLCARRCVATVRCRPLRFQTCCFSDSNSPAVKVAFSVPYRCLFGQHICLVGSDDKLGSWDAKKGISMDWTSGDVWQLEMDLAPRQGRINVEYKYVVRNQDGQVGSWQPGENVQLKLPVQPESIQRLRILDAWDGSMHEVQVEAPASAEAVQSVQAGDLAGGGQQPQQMQALDTPQPSAGASPLMASAGIDELAVVAQAADRALAELDAAILDTLELLDQSEDPASPLVRKRELRICLRTSSLCVGKVLAADRKIAAAARRAVAMSKALKSAEPAGVRGLLAPHPSAQNPPKQDPPQQLQGPLQPGVQENS